MFGKDAIAEALATNFQAVEDDTYEVDDVTRLVPAAHVDARRSETVLTVHGYRGRPTDRPSGQQGG